MKKVILVAGPPATGKTYMSNVIKDKQLDVLNEVKEQFNADFLTIRLVGDLDVLYDRHVERDLVDTRNKGHIMDAYHGYESYEKHIHYREKPISAIVAMVNIISLNLVRRLKLMLQIMQI